MVVPNVEGAVEAEAVISTKLVRERRVVEKRGREEGSGLLATWRAVAGRGSVEMARGEEPV